MICISQGLSILAGGNINYWQLYMGSNSFSVYWFPMNLGMKLEISFYIHIQMLCVKHWPKHFFSFINHLLQISLIIIILRCVFITGIPIYQTNKKMSDVGFLTLIATLFSMVFLGQDQNLGKYSYFSLFMGVKFYEVTAYWFSEYSITASRGNTELNSCEPLATFLSIDQQIILFYACFNLKTPNLVNVIDSLILDQRSIAL